MRRNKRGEDVVGTWELVREVSRELGLPERVIREVIDAYHRRVWDHALRERRVRMGPLGSVRLARVPVGGYGGPAGQRLTGVRAYFSLTRRARRIWAQYRFAELDYREEDAPPSAPAAPAGDDPAEEFWW